MTKYVEENIQQNNVIDKTTALLNEIISSIPDMDKNELYSLMKSHVQLAFNIYSKAINDSLQNEQEFMNWQDELNAITYVHSEDL